MSFLSKNKPLLFPFCTEISVTSRNTFFLFGYNFQFQKMKKTLSGIDEFKISWQAYNIPERNNPDDIWQLYETKKHDEPLIDFFKRNLKYIIIPKYFINGTDIALWWNLHYYESKILDNGLHYINSIYAFHQTCFSLPSLKLILFQLLGGKVDMSILADLGFKIDFVKIDWQQVIKEENEDVQLYCCGCCGDRGCGSFRVEISKENHLIKWMFPGYTRDFIFDFSLYEKEFREFQDYLDGYEKFKIKWAEHSKLITYEDMKGEISFGEYKKYLLGEKIVNW